MGSDRSLYLRQKQGETLLKLSHESYDRMMESQRTHVIGHRNRKPVVKFVSST